MPRRFTRALSLLMVLSAAGCGSDMAEHDYRQHFPLAVSRHEAVAEIAMPPTGQTLPDADRVRLDQMGREHIRRGAGPVAVVVGAEDNDASKAAAKGFGDTVAAALNLPAGEVGVAVMVGGKPSPGVAQVSVPVWVSDVPSCGNWDWAATPNYENGTTANFGCATQRNLGLMVQNPADLVRMRDSSGRDANRAADDLEKYRKGVATGSASESNGSVSTTGQ